MPLRHRIVHHLVRIAIRLSSPPLTLEGMLMSTILARIAALETSMAAIQARATEHDDTLANVASKDDVAALEQKIDTLPIKDTVDAAVGPLADRVSTIEGEIGTDPAPATTDTVMTVQPAPAPLPDADTGDQSGAGSAGTTITDTTTGEQVTI